MFALLIRCFSLFFLHNTVIYFWNMYAVSLWFSGKLHTGMTFYKKKKEKKLKNVRGKGGDIKYLWWFFTF